MTQPGDRLREWAKRRCSPTAMERVIDPSIADLQAEHRAATASGRIWHRRRVLIGGYIAFAKVVALCLWSGSMESPRTDVVRDRRVVIRTAGLALGVIALLTVALEVPPLQFVRVPRFAAQAASLVALLWTAWVVVLAVGTARRRGAQP